MDQKIKYVTQISKLALINWYDVNADLYQHFRSIIHFDFRLQRVDQYLRRLIFWFEVNQEPVSKMVKMSPDTKYRVQTVLNVVKTTFHWGFIPAVLYMGFKKGSDPGMPAISLLSLLWQ